MVTTPTVRMPISRAALAMIGAAPVPVPPPMPAVMKHMWQPDRRSTISSINSSAAAAPTSGRAPAPSPSVTRAPSWSLLPAWLCWSAWASVLATTNSQPSSAFSIMLLTALPPAPPTPITVIRGLRSWVTGMLRFSAICCYRLLWSPLPPRPRADLFLIRYRSPIDTMGHAESG